MRNEEQQEDLKRHIRDLERKIAQLERKLEKERNEKEIAQQQKKELEKENRKLKKELARLQGSALVLAGSDKTAEAGGVPTSKTFYRRNRQEGKKKPTGGQPGHPGHGRKKPIPNSPPIHVIQEVCSKCGTPLGEPVKGTEQKRTVTDIPLPGHVIYEVIYCSKMCRTSA